MTTDGRRNPRHLGVAIIGILCLTAAVNALVPAPTTVSRDGLDLPLEPLSVADTTVLHDGLGHHLVRAPALSPTVPTAEPDATPAAAPVLRVDELAALGSQVHHLDGDGATDLVAVLDDGRRVPVRPEEPETVAARPGGLGGLIADAATRRVERLGDGWYAVTTARDDADFAELVDRLGIESIPDVPLQTFSDDERAGDLWGLDNRGNGVIGGVQAVLDVDTDGVEARSVERGDGVIVAVIDSGADPGHADLPVFWSNTDENCDNRIDDDGNGYVDDCHGWDFFNDDNSPFDLGVDNSHGTHVTGTIAATPDNRVGIAGLSPGVTIMNLKALENGSTWMSSAAAAVRYAVDNGASVINASWGSTGATRAQVPALEAAVEYAREHGVVVVAAAGNAGADLATSPTFPASFPHDNVISVGAHTAAGAAPGFSNHGDVEVDLHAPGHYIVSTVPGGYAAKQGTSMAAPHVTAAVALVQARDPGADVTAVRRALLDTVDRRPDLEGLSATGGSLNAARAIGVEAGVEGAPLEVTVHGLDTLTDGATGSLSVRTVVRDPSILGGRPVHVRATVLTSIAGVDHGVVGLPVTVDGRPTSTDDHAQFLLGAAHSADDTALLRGVHHTVGLALPAGQYALVVELVDARDPDAAYGPAAVVFTNVPATDSPAEGDGDVNGGGGDPDSMVDAPIDPAPTTPTPGPSPAPPPAPAPPGGAPTPDAGGAPAPTTGAPMPDEGAEPVTNPPPASTPPDETQRDETERDDPAAPAPTAPPAGAAPAPPPEPGWSPPADPAPSVDEPAHGVPPAPREEPLQPVTRAGMTLLKVAPSWGRPAGGNLTVLHGRHLPDAPRVFVGPFPVQVHRSSPTSLLVEMPAATPGSYDVTVIGDGGEVRLRLGYVYAPEKPVPGEPVAPGPSAPPTFSDPDPAAPSAPEDGDASPAPVSVDDGPTADPDHGSGPDDPTNDPSSDHAAVTTTTTLPPPDGRARLELTERAASQPAELLASLPAGVSLHRVVVGSPVELPAVDWPARSCRRPACGAELHLWDQGG